MSQTKAELEEALEKAEKKAEKLQARVDELEASQPAAADGPSFGPGAVPLESR